MNKLIFAMLLFCGTLFCLTGIPGCAENDYEYARLACKKQRKADFRDFERFSKLFLSGECSSPGTLSLFSYLADLSYGARYLPGTPCSRAGQPLLVNQEKEPIVAGIESEEHLVIEKRREVLDLCFAKFIKENPLQCYFWASVHSKELSSNMVSSIFDSINSNRPYRREYYQILLNLYGSCEADVGIGGNGSATYDEVLFDAMYSMWKTNSDYVIQYNDEGLRISVADEEPYFRYAKMTPPLIFVVSNLIQRTIKQ